MRRLIVGVIGLGVGEQHVAAYLTHPACEVAALCDLSAEKRAMAKSKYPGARITGDANELLHDPAIDVVSIASYDDAHFEQVLMALRNGRHVFVEKPLCRSLKELRAIKQSWLNGQRLHLVSNLVLRAAPLYEWLRTQIHVGTLGGIYAFDGDYLYGRVEKITQGWRKDVAKYSVVQGGGIHLVDLLLWATGERPVSVAAVGNQIATSGTGFQYPDYVAATYEFSSGLVGRITANFGCVHRHQHVVRIFGTKGTFLYDDTGPRLHGTRDPSIPPRALDMAPLPSSKGSLIPAFVDSILTGRDTQEDTQHEFDVISACVAADEALKNRGAVEVEYV